MALTGSGTTGVLTATEVGTVAHGLGTTPDHVAFSAITIGAATRHPIVVSADATNVLISNPSAVGTLTNAAFVATIVHTLVA